MIRSKFQILIFGGAVILGSSNIQAQTFGVEYATEWQTDFSGAYDWLNLLKMSVDAPINDKFVFQTTTISTSKTAETPLVEDLLTYSNIEAGNIPLTFARLGLGFTVKNAEFFAGIYNVNEDFFTSDLTSFFTNSSCGISPTISCNFDIANYPLAAWCLHYRQQFSKFGFQTSLYPGKGYSRLLGHDNLFSLNFKRDGVFSISSLDYKQNGIFCVLGLALHYGVCMADEEGQQTAQAWHAPSKKIAATPWLLSEFTIASNLGLHAHASYSTVHRGCKGYAGVGLIYEGRRVQPGMALNYACFKNAPQECAWECSAELSARMQIVADRAFVQPTLHIIKNAQLKTKCVGMLRFVLILNS